MDLSNVLNVLQAALGIGLVIFVHELGHFLAARWCGVRVETFSLGFGPPLWTHRRGATTYQLAMVPFGGFVRMHGEAPDPDATGEPAPDSLRAKSVPQRFLIYSGGVIMNLVFALVCFPLVYGFGLPVQEPVIGAPTPGGAAWEARLPEGSRLLTVDGTEVNDFFDVAQEVALNGDRPLDLTYLAPGADAPTPLTLRPRRDPQEGIYRIGVRPGYDPEQVLGVLPGGAAEAAGLRDGARLVEVEGRPEGVPVSAWLEHLWLAEEPVTLVVDQGQGPEPHHVVPAPLVGEAREVFGVRQIRSHVAEVRPGGPAEAAGLRAGDDLLALDDLRPVTGPELLAALLTDPRPRTLEVRRQGEVTALELPALPPAQGLELFRDLHLEALDGDLRVWVAPDSGAAAAGLTSGDSILAVNGREVSTWPEIHAACGDAVTAGGEARFLLAGPDGAERTLTARATPQRILDHGFGLRMATGLFRTHGVGASIREGTRASWRFLVSTWMTLQRMLTQEVSPKQLGGIITISRVSYQVSSVGWTKLLFFLCVLSVNLALLNVLPIPVLDGGHLFFLLVEGIKGSPVSERTLGYSQVVGLVMIVSLMIYVTYNDILRWVAS